MFENLHKKKWFNELTNSLISIVFFIDKSKKRKLKSKIREKYYFSRISELTNEITKKYPDFYIFFSRYGLGDIFFTASLIKEFKKTHSGKVVFLTEKKYLVEYLKSFSSIDEVVYDDRFKVFQSSEFLQHKIEKGQINVLLFPYRGKKENHVFADSYSNFLEVDRNSERELPVISDKNYENANLEYKKLKINPKSTIILIPEATMFNDNILDKSFWKKLANILTEKGYDVVFNTKNKAYKKYKTTFLPVMDFIAFAQKVKYIISFRSGINDLFAGMNIKNLSAIYPNEMYVHWANLFFFNQGLNQYFVKPFESEFDNIFHIYSLNSNFNCKELDEIIYKYDEEKLLQHLIKRVEQ